MYKSSRVVVVIPAYNEERLIGLTLSKVPQAIDAIFVVDDGSHDKTAELVLKQKEIDPRVHLIKHRSNKGVGGAIITGYSEAYKQGYDIFVVVGGDAQMDWDDLDALLEPIQIGRADYTKGNRFIYGKSKDSPGNAWREMPTHRILGNVTLSILTKFASGYYHIYDSQMGYTALHRDVFPLIEWDRARKGYGYPAEWLTRFHICRVKVEDVPVRAIYLENEKQTQIRVGKFLFYMIGVLMRGYARRLIFEYFVGRNRRLQVPNRMIS